MKDNLVMEIMLNFMDDQGETVSERLTINNGQIVYLEHMQNTKLMFPYINVNFNIGKSDHKLLNFTSPEFVSARIMYTHQNITKTYDCFVMSFIGTTKGNDEDNTLTYDIQAKLIAIDPTKLRIFMKDAEDYTTIYSDNSLHLIKSVFKEYDVEFHKDINTNDYMHWKRIKQNDIQFLNYIRSRMDISTPIIVMKQTRQNDIMINGIYVADFERLNRKNMDQTNSIVLDYKRSNISNMVKNYDLDISTDKPLITYNKDTIGFEIKYKAKTSNSDDINIDVDEIHDNFIERKSTNELNNTNLIKMSGDIINTNIDLFDFPLLELCNYLRIDDDIYLITQIYYKYVQKIPKPVIALKVFKI